jgi:hypothetical protein
LKNIDYPFQGNESINKYLSKERKQERNTKIKRVRNKS